MPNFCKIIVLLFAPLLIHAQNSCNKYPLKQLNIIPNPSFEFLDTESRCFSHNILPPSPITQSWYSPTYYTLCYQDPVAYLVSCSNFVIADSLIYLPLLTGNSHTDIFYPIVPQPVPNGNGIIAINDWPRFLIGSGFKSYTAACLNTTLQKDSLYMLDFMPGLVKIAGGI